MTRNGTSGETPLGEMHRAPVRQNAIFSIKRQLNGKDENQANKTIAKMKSTLACRFQLLNAFRSLLVCRSALRQILR